MNPTRTQPHFRAAPPGARAVELPTRLNDEDLALGCQCADPALQVERWFDEGPQAPLATC